VRLMRLTRVLRLLRSRVFKDLLTMLEGMLGGLTTLAWAVVLFMIIVYVAALVFKEGLESLQSTGVMKEQFETVPISMFTIFRCSFGDCSTKNGTPFLEHMRKENVYWTLAFSAFIFFMVIGLFNVISAIFVESTMAAAADIAWKKNQKKLDDEVRWSTCIMIFLRALLELTPMDAPEFSWEDTPDMQSKTLQERNFSRKDVDAALKKEEVQRALSRLDIDPQDYRYLSDILDPSNRGEISTLELVDGLKRMRGKPHRGDIVAVDLMVRSIQEKVTDMMRWLEEGLQSKLDNESLDSPGTQLRLGSDRTYPLVSDCCEVNDQGGQQFFPFLAGGFTAAL